MSAQQQPAKQDTSSDDAAASYSTMSVGDVEAIGAHCQAPFCHQLDFLPFRCESCKGKFCLQHRTEDAHACTVKGAWARARRDRDNASSPSTHAQTAKPTILTHDRQCSAPACKKLIDTPLTPGIHCATCRRDYCLRHRLAEDHACASVSKEKPNDGGVANALSKLRAWGAQRRAAAVSSSSSTSSASRKAPAPAANVTAPLSRTDTATTTASLEERQPKLARIISPFASRRPKASGGNGSGAVAAHVIALKRSARGDAKIPSAQRVYVHLEAVAGGEGASGAKVPRAEAWFGREWSVGKVLDGAARTLQVSNVNNRGGGEEEKLRVFWVEGGRLLAFGEKVGACVKDGDTLVLLRGVGAP